MPPVRKPLALLPVTSLIAVVAWASLATPAWADSNAATVVAVGGTKTWILIVVIVLAAAGGAAYWMTQRNK